MGLFSGVSGRAKQWLARTVAQGVELDAAEAKAIIPMAEASPGRAASMAGKWPLGHMTPGRTLPISQLNHPYYNTEWSIEDAIHNGLKKSHWVYACVTKIMRAASSVPWKTQVLKKKQWEDAPDHPFTKLLAKPNPYMSGQDLIERIASHLFLSGNAILSENIVGKTVMELWPLHPDKIKPIPDAVDYISAYQWRQDGTIIYLPTTEIIHFQFCNPSTPLWGLSPMQAIWKMVQTEIGMANWWHTSLANRLIPDGMVRFKAPMTPTQYEQTLEFMKEQRLGGGDSGNARMPLLAGYDAEFTPMNMTPAEMDWIESRQMSRIDICSVFGVPPPIVGIYDNATFNNIQTARRIFWLDTIIPFLADLESTLNLALAPDDKTRITYDLTNVEALAEDFAVKLANAKSLFAIGVSLNSIIKRLELGIPDQPGGDVGLVPSTLIPLTDASTTALPLPSKEQAAAAAAAKKDAEMVIASERKLKVMLGLDPDCKHVGACPCPDWMRRGQLHEVGRGTVVTLIDEASASVAAAGSGIERLEALLAAGADAGAGADGASGADGVGAAGASANVGEGVQGALGAGGAGTKADDSAARYWRTFDRQRRGFEKAMKTRVHTMFGDQKEKCVQALLHGGDVEQALTSDRATWTRSFVATWRGTIAHFGGVVARQLGGSGAKADEEYLTQEKDEASGLPNVSAVAEFRDEFVKTGAPFALSVEDLETNAVGDWVFDPWPDDVHDYVMTVVGEHITSIDAVTLANVRVIIANGFEQGKSIVAIAAELEAGFDEFSERRSIVIARTEVIGASNYGARQGALQSGIAEGRGWISSGDDRVRASHVALNGTRIEDMTTPYVNGCMYPGDPNGPAEEVICCRCAEQFFLVPR